MLCELLSAFDPNKINTTKKKKSLSSTVRVEWRGKTHTGVLTTVRRCPSQQPSFLTWRRGSQPWSFASLRPKQGTGGQSVPRPGDVQNWRDCPRFVSLSITPHEKQSILFWIMWSDNKYFSDSPSSYREILCPRHIGLSDHAQEYSRHNYARHTCASCLQTLV